MFVYCAEVPAESYKLPCHRQCVAVVSKPKTTIMQIKNFLILATLLISSINGYSQTYSSNVSFIGAKTVVLTTTKMEAQGKLSSGETIKSGCDHGACYFQIIYNGRKIGETLGENFSALKIYEFDFGGDGDKELVVVVDQQKINKRGDYDGQTTMLYVYRYSKGQLQKIFEKEVMYYKTVIKKSYIEYYMPSGLDTIWHYYLGTFYEMTPVQIKN